MAKKRIDIMVDLETLGTGLDALVFQIAAVSFNIKTGETVHDFNECADIAKATPADGEVDGGTLKWWLDTDSELLTKLLNKGGFSPSELIGSFHVWLETVKRYYDEVYLWGNGILFDNAILRYKFEKAGLEYPIFFRNDRDVRTILELAVETQGTSERELRSILYDETLEAHDAFNDVINQISLVVDCRRIIVEGARFF